MHVYGTLEQVGPPLWSPRSRRQEEAAGEGAAPAGVYAAQPRDTGSQPIPRDIQWTHPNASRPSSRRGVGAYNPAARGGAISNIQFG